MTRNMSYAYDFEAHKNLSQKHSVLFYGHPRNLLENKTFLSGIWQYTRIYSGSQSVSSQNFLKLIFIFHIDNKI